jgi:hypothetical protein
MNTNRSFVAGGARLALGDAKPALTDIRAQHKDATVVKDKEDR